MAVFPQVKGPMLVIKETDLKAHMAVLTRGTGVPCSPTLPLTKTCFPPVLFLSWPQSRIQYVCILATLRSILSGEALHSWWQMAFPQSERYR